MFTVYFQKKKYYIKLKLIGNSMVVTREKEGVVVKGKRGHKMVTGPHWFGLNG